MNKPGPLFPQSTPLVAISACLRGEKVRYDGRDKFSTLIDQLSRQVQWLPLCPEMNAGLGTPRPPVALVDSNQGIRVLGRDQPTLDVTERLQQAAQTSIRSLSGQPVCGYIWQSRSPSCGYGSTPLYDQQQRELGKTSGVQAQRVQQQLPWLIQAEDTELQCHSDCQRFLQRCAVINDVLCALAQQREADLFHHYAAQLTITQDTHQFWFQQQPRQLLQHYHGLAFGQTAGVT